jgi:hypothetical protein
MQSSGVCLISPMTSNSFQPSEQTEISCARRTLLPEGTAERAFGFGIARNGVSAVACRTFTQAHVPLKRLLPCASLFSNDQYNLSTARIMTSIIDEQFTKALNAAYKLYQEDRLLECQKAALDLLEDDVIPRYHRMKVLILLASILGDWEEANQCRVDAWALYNLVRRWHPVGNNLTADESLDQILVQLREVDSALEEGAPEEWTLAEVQESVEIVIHNAEDDIEATRQELEVFNMAEDAAANTKAKLDVVKPTESAGLTLPVAAKPRKVSVRDK